MVIFTHRRSTPLLTMHSWIISGGCQMLRWVCSVLLRPAGGSAVPLGGSAEQHFTEAVPMEMAARFRDDLKRLSCDIRARNVGLKLPYVYLDPATVEDSVTR
ncbi:Hydroperoxide isomerase ALOXE3 [Collichthys lucidus]|uniref:Hydroperoxide isomerase ALOXE3 n=1 Tax=Collichthys lucidus TaxID=240159 RepID=A0A4U5VBB7_COLLU|nr:Hydroperoxide isomerase ALOXE3 [Collichthys lucidus]